jgi:hypothetical protein
MRESIDGMKKRSLITLRIAIELLLAAYFSYSGVHLFRGPRFALPTYMYVGPAALSLLIGVCFALDAARVAWHFRTTLRRRPN